MDISKITFSGAYRIKCKDLNQARKIKESLPKNIDFNQSGKDIVIISSPCDDKSNEVLNSLKENTDTHDKPKCKAIIDIYTRNSKISPGQIVDTYR